MEDAPGNYRFPNAIEGNTVSAKTMTFLQDGLPMTFTSAVLTFKDASGETARTATSGSGLTIASNVVTVDEFTAMAAGTYKFDMTFTMTDGDVKTLLVGQFKTVKAD